MAPLWASWARAAACPPESRDALVAPGTASLVRVISPGRSACNCCAQLRSPADPSTDRQQETGRRAAARPGNPFVKQRKKRLDNIRSDLLESDWRELGSVHPKT